MALLNYQVFDNVTGIHDFVEKLKDFALAQGWTVNDFIQNTQFQSGSGFVSGNETFLQISSSGFGSQNMVFRFRAEASGTDPESETLTTGGHKTTVFSNSGQHPVLQDDWNTSGGQTSYHPSSIPMVWFFGNDKFIFSVAMHSNTILTFLMFGSVNLIDTSYTEGEIIASDSSLIKWYTGNHRFPLDGLLWAYYNGAGNQSAGFNQRVRVSFSANSTTITTNRAFASWGKSIESNNDFSEKRAIVKPVMYFQDSDDLWFPAGDVWLYRVYALDLPVGGEITFGSEKYLCFPNGNVTFPFGVAVRIA